VEAVAQQEAVAALSASHASRGEARYPARVTRYLGPGLLALALLALSVLVVRQGTRIDALQAELSELQARSARPAAAVEVRAASPPRASESVLRPAAAPAPALLPPAPRASVSVDEVARVESAVLSLLEADRPELREKLRAVVQEHQESAERERQEQRRERWVARTEARLSQLTGDAALSAVERESVVAIMLGTRDQIAELRRSAETPEAILKAREQVRGLRQDADAQLRKLLGDARYEAFDRVVRDDDDDDEQRGRGRPSLR
jgi:hypothetical protein